MTLPLTPEMLETAYEFLKTTPPFSRWKLPESDDVKFVISRDPAIFGKWDCVGDDHTITISAANVGFTDTLLSTMAHEMIHLHVKQIGHPAAFKKHAARVCKYHGFDPKAFC